MTGFLNLSLNTPNKGIGYAHMALKDTGVGEMFQLAPTEANDV